MYLKDLMLPKVQLFIGYYFNINQVLANVKY